VQTDDYGNFATTFQVPYVIDKVVVRVEEQEKTFESLEIVDKVCNLKTLTFDFETNYKFEDEIKYELDDKPYSGVVTWISNSEHRIQGKTVVDNGQFIIDPLQESVTELDLRINIHQTNVSYENIAVKKEGNIFKFADSPLVLGGYASTTKAPTEPVQYNVTVNGKIEYSYGKGFNAQDVFVMFNDKYAVTDKTDSEGIFSVKYPAGAELPTKVTVSAAGMTLKSWEGNDLFDNTQTFNISETLIVPGMSGIYSIRGEILYNDHTEDLPKPYVGMVKLSDNQG
jgi:hypothetical protein